MGPKTVLGISIFFLTLSAHAERWIVKNAKVMPPSAKVIKTVHFGNDAYTVLEADEQHLRLMNATRADVAFPDPKIELVLSQPAAASGADGWHIARMGYDRIPAGIDGRGVTVAVLDTGVDYKHQALMNHIWSNPLEIAGNGVDDDGNGYIDDVMGYDFADKDNDPMDSYDHGTHCAGIIASDANAAGTARGVAPGVKIMPLRIIGGSGTGFLSDAADAIKYAVDNDAKVLSNSWRIYKSWANYFDEKGVEFLFAAIKYTETRGAIFVNAAGNETTNIDISSDEIYPSGMQGLSHLFVVAATENGDIMAGYSNYGKNKVHVAAPGSDILATVGNNSWSQMSGTSMATPLVAGVLALGLQQGMTAEEAMTKLVATSDPFRAFDSKVISRGIINIQNFLQ